MECKNSRCFNGGYRLHQFIALSDGASSHLPCPSPPSTTCSPPIKLQTDWPPALFRPALMLHQRTRAGQAVNGILHRSLEFGNSFFFFFTCLCETYYITPDHTCDSEFANIFRIFHFLKGHSTPNHLERTGQVMLNLSIILSM